MPALFTGACRARTGYLVSRLLPCAICCAAFGLGACAGDPRGPIVARVNGSTIGRGELDHWASAVDRGAKPGEALGLSLGGSAREAALGFLIRARWLSAAAAVEGAPVSKETVARTLQERREVSDEFGRELASKGQTLADAKLEIQAELSADAIRRVLDKRAADVARREVLAFYRRHPRRFRLGEVRETELIEGLPNRALAAALVRQARSGARLSRRVTNYETLRLEPVPDRERAAALHAIFTAPRGLASLIRLDEEWAVFVVRRIFPARLASFAQARGSARAALVAQRRRLLAAQYLKAYRARWTAETSCRSGYIVQGCRQYRGRSRPEPDLFSGG
jgi:hypothetical protein